LLSKSADISLLMRIEHVQKTKAYDYIYF